mmetsp:Transcript_36123/g.84591  ORF Transcript_36123/g.84591 Transcript_36123/m.84591 type:complete len:208 (+) Transcript_36123:783-1406(+)
MCTWIAQRLSRANGHQLLPRGRKTRHPEQECTPFGPREAEPRHEAHCRQDSLRRHSWQDGGEGLAPLQQCFLLPKAGSCLDQHQCAMRNHRRQEGGYQRRWHTRSPSETNGDSVAMGQSYKLPVWHSDGPETLRAALCKLYRGGAAWGRKRARVQQRQGARPAVVHRRRDYPPGDRTLPRGVPSGCWPGLWSKGAMLELRPEAWAQG